MSDTDKEKGDKEYRDGYYTGRDGDPATRAFDGFFGYTSSDTTYGKGHQAGRDDRYKYGSRDNNVASDAVAEPIPKSKSSRNSSSEYSS